MIADAAMESPQRNRKYSQVVKEYAVGLSRISVPQFEYNRRPSNRRKFYGVSKECVGLEAARDLTQRRYFYVGNLAMKTTTDALKDYVSGFSVELLKCNETYTNFRNTAAFHVCLEKKFVFDFLDVTNWPQHVIIREWYFKEKKAADLTTRVIDNTDAPKAQGSEAETRDDSEENVAQGSAPNDPEISLENTLIEDGGEN